MTMGPIYDQPDEKLDEALDDIGCVILSGVNKVLQNKARQCGMFDEMLNALIDVYYLLPEGSSANPRIVDLIYRALEIQK